MTRDYYCNNKFKFLKIDLEKAITYNCHAAKPQFIDFNWLKLNKGNLFNNPISVHERQQMLNNQRNKSCEQNCWPAEDTGQISVRLLESGNKKTHFDTVTFPEILDITLDTDCNLKCVYCCKEYSSTWRKELTDFGDFPFDTDDENFNRFSLNQKDRVIQILGQKQKQNSKHTPLILDEIVKFAPTLKTVIITGGEPFLSSQLVKILQICQEVPEIKIFTGLGITSAKLEKTLKTISRYKNVFLSISAESVNETYDLLRSGTTYEDFINRFNIIKNSGIRFEIHSTLTNLGILSFFEFYKNYSNYTIKIDFVYTPKFLSVNVLDHVTKNKILDLCSKQKQEIFSLISSSVKPSPTKQQHKDLKLFLYELQRRRGLNLNIFPKEFTEWILLNIGGGQ